MLTARALFADLGHALATDYFFLREQLTDEQLDLLQIGRLAERNQLSDTIAGLAKLNNTRKARQICADARDMLGGNGILLESHVIRHMADIEAIQPTKAPRRCGR